MQEGSMATATYWVIDFAAIGLAGVLAVLMTLKMTRFMLGAVCIFLAGIARADDYQRAYDLLKGALTAQERPIDRQEIIKPKDIKQGWPRTHMRRRYAILPPEEFDHPYEGELVVVRVDTPEALVPYCRNTGRVLGCSQRRFDNKCFVYLIPDGFYESVDYDPEDVYRHEVGHCNGWPGNHPGARNAD
jgi:hypothetical protein